MHLRVLSHNLYFHITKNHSPTHITIFIFRLPKSQNKNSTRKNLLFSQLIPPLFSLLINIICNNLFETTIFFFRYEFVTELVFYISFKIYWYIIFFLNLNCLRKFNFSLCFSNFIVGMKRLFIGFIINVRLSLKGIENKCTSA